MDSYKTIAGETIEYPRPTQPTAAFLSEVMRAAHDPRVSEAQLVELIYGKANPLLDQNILPGRGAVTRATLANPVYHVMLDLLDAKRLQSGTLSPNAIDAFTLTVSEAARQLEVSPGAVRQAIAAGKLTATKRGVSYFVDPRSVDAYREKHTRRGPAAAPALRVRYGNKPGASFRVKFSDLVETSREGNVVDAEVARFSRAAVAFSSEGVNRLYVLEPSEKIERFGWSGFFVEGKFKVVDKVNNPGKASEVFKSFQPA